jgi:transposase InsO family protein
MPEKSAPAIPSRYRLKVKQRLVVLEYVKTHSLLATSRRFGMNRKTIREWRARYEAKGVAGLIPTYPDRRKSRLPAEVLLLIEQARREFGYGAARTRVWLQRVHHKSYPVKTIHRAFVRLGLPRLASRKKRVVKPRQLRLFEMPHPGDSVQVDVKVVKIKGQKAYQYTALDDCTRYRVLRLYRRQNQRVSLDFFAELRAVLPFPIRRLQCDNGTEFPLAFALTVQAAGIEHRYIKPRCPEQNGKVERSHRIDNEEFWGRQEFGEFEIAARELRAWERTYNFVRFSTVLHGSTPVEKLQRLLPDVKVA